MNTPKLTIGQLAKRLGMNTSALRYYESQGLLMPDERTDAGYRLYGEEAETRLRFIGHAQRLGFSLADIQTLIEAQETDDLDQTAVMELAEARFLAIEKQLTPLLIQQHELRLFWRELQTDTLHGSVADLFAPLMDSTVHSTPLSAATVLDLLSRVTQCSLETDMATQILAALQGQHIHFAQDDTTYHISVHSQETAVGDALAALTLLDADCETYPMPQLRQTDDGWQLSVTGDHAFVYVRLFLALSQDS